VYGSFLLFAKRAEAKYGIPRASCCWSWAAAAWWAARKT
jgi:hypothetical protein